jgi:hypothetical protein
MRSLIANIIYMAIKDWNAHKDDIRKFFNSKWADTLCDELNLSAKDILNKLERGEINVSALEVI